MLLSPIQTNTSIKCIPRLCFLKSLWKLASGSSVSSALSLTKRSVGHSFLFVETSVSLRWVCSCPECVPYGLLASSRFRAARVGNVVEECLRGRKMFRAKERCAAEKNADYEDWEEWWPQEWDVGGDQGGGDDERWVKREREEFLYPRKTTDKKARPLV